MIASSLPLSLLPTCKCTHTENQHVWLCSRRTSKKKNCCGYQISLTRSCAPCCAEPTSVDRTESRSADLVRSEVIELNNTTDGRGSLDWTDMGHPGGGGGGGGGGRLLLCICYMEAKMIDQYAFFQHFAWGTHHCCMHLKVLGCLFTPLSVPMHVRMHTHMHTHIQCMHT